MGDITNNSYEDIFYSISCDCNNNDIYIQNKEGINKQTHNTIFFRTKLKKEALLLDFNNDGKLDLLGIEKDSTLVLYENINTLGHNFISLEINTDDIKSAILYSEDKIFYKDNFVDNYKIFSKPKRIHFGLENTLRVDSIEITNNNGNKSKVYDLEVNKLNIIEDLEFKEMNNSDLQVRVYPNPYFEEVQIEFFNPNNQKVSIGIYGVEGKILKELKNSILDEGYFNIYWDGTNDLGRQLSTGIYLLKIQTHETEYIKQIIKQN